VSKVVYPLVLGQHGDSGPGGIHHSRKLNRDPLVNLRCFEPDLCHRHILMTVLGFVLYGSTDVDTHLVADTDGLSALQAGMGRTASRPGFFLFMPLVAPE